MTSVRYVKTVKIRLQPKKNSEKVRNYTQDFDCCDVGDSLRTSLGSRDICQTCENLCMRAQTNICHIWARTIDLNVVLYVYAQSFDSCGVSLSLFMT